MSCIAELRAERCEGRNRQGWETPSAHGPSVHIGTDPTADPVGASLGGALCKRGSPISSGPMGSTAPQGVRGWGPSTEQWGCPMWSTEHRCPPPQPRWAALGPLIPPRCRGNNGIQRRSDLTAWQTSHRDTGRGTAPGGAERGGRGGCPHPLTGQLWGGAVLPVPHPSAAASPYWEQRGRKPHSQSVMRARQDRGIRLLRMGPSPPVPRRSYLGCIELVSSSGALSDTPCWAVMLG